MYKTYNSVYLAVEYPSNIFSLYAYGLLCVSVNVKKGIEENLLYGMPMHNEKIIFYKEILVKDASIYVKITEPHLLLCKKIRVGNSHSLFLFLLLIVLTIFYKGIMPSEKVLDFPVDCNTLTGSVNL